MFLEFQFHLIPVFLIMTTCFHRVLVSHSGSVRSIVSRNDQCHRRLSTCGYQAFEFCVQERLTVKKNEKKKKKTGLRFIENQFLVGQCAFVDDKPYGLWLQKWAWIASDHFLSAKKWSVVQEERLSIFCFSLSHDNIRVFTSRCRLSSLSLFNPCFQWKQKVMQRAFLYTSWFCSSHAQWKRSCVKTILN